MDEPVTEPTVAAHAVAPLRPWGFWTTLGWALAALVLWFAAQLAVVLAFIAWRHGHGPMPDLARLASDGFLLALAVTVATPVAIAVFAFAARLRGWRVRDYLALAAPGRRELLFGIGCLVALLVAFDLITWLVGRDIVPSFMVEAYKSARAANALPLMFVAIVVMAPLGEEIAFRGFLFRGLAASRIGIHGTLVLTSAAWALMHVQYDAFILLMIFGIGLLLGWLRWASGSVLLTIILHMLANLAACVQAAIKIEWLS
jgi:CAAX protease family protein